MQKLDYRIYVISTSVWDIILALTVGERYFACEEMKLTDDGYKCTFLKFI